MKINKTKGFTLIELLVVIAIIAIISSVVLASLSTARDRARISALKQNVASFRKNAEIIRSRLGHYSATDPASPSSNANCFPPSSVPDYLKNENTLVMEEFSKILLSNDGLSSAGCGANKNSYALSLRLSHLEPGNIGINSMNRLCIDSRGVTIVTNTAASGNVVKLPDGQFVCISATSTSNF